MINLKCIGHEIEYELTNIIRLFEPYAKEEYRLESICEKEKVQARLYKDEDLLCAKDEALQLVGKPLEDKKQMKNKLKKTVYEVLSSTFHIKMPWGILTGIRPTKIVHDYWSEGLSSKRIQQILKEEYLVSPPKIDMMLQVAEKEKSILDKNKKNEVSVYIGIPFCPTRCVYCSFTAYSLEKKGEWVEQYLDVLCKEIDYVADAKKDVFIRSLYIGGGTPTSLSCKQLERLLRHIKERFNIDELEEYTLEAGRPDTITREKLQVAKSLGVSRISINPQTMNEKTLETIGRKHTVQDTIRVFHEARELGFDNINMDMILGLPGEQVPEVSHTLEELTKLGPDNLTVHTLAIKRASILNENKEDYVVASAQEIEEMIDLCQKAAKGMELEPYYMYRQKNMLGNFENVGYAKKGKESIYNIEIMEEKETILALGAGAITKIVYQDGQRIDRIPNVKNLEQYIERIDEMIERKKEGFIKYI